MVQSPSWEANWFEVTQEIPRISRNPKVHYRTHKRPPAISILGQPNLVQVPTSHLLEIHPIIINPSTPRSPQGSLSLRFPHQDLRLWNYPCTLRTVYKWLRNCTWNGYHMVLIPQRCNFMLLNFMSLRILIIPTRPTLVFFWSETVPEDGNRCRNT